MVGGHLSEVLKNRGIYNVFSTDIVNRRYKGMFCIKDFINDTPFTNLKVDILTNPPYKYAQEFVEHALDI